MPTTGATYFSPSSRLSAKYNSKAVAIRMPVKGIRVAGRNTQGVRLVNLEPNDLVTDVARVVPDDETDSGDEAEPAGVGGEGPDVDEE